MMPLRNSSTQTTKIRPVTMVTDSPSVENHSTPVRRCRKRPNSPILFSSMTTTAEPRMGPDSVPRPPISVIRITWPEVVQCTSDSVAKPSTTVLSEPARPVSAAEITKASSLKRATS